MFIGVKDDINAIRHILRVHRHTFKVVGSVHEDADLSIVRVTEVQVRYTTPNFDDAIFQRSALVAV